MSGRLITAFVVAFLVSTALGAFLVPWLRRMKAGQEIRKDGPVWHMSKSGTPTMGGIMFIVACGVVCFTVGFSELMNGEGGHVFMFVFAAVFGAIGFTDDWFKLKKKQNLGLTAGKKFLLQIAMAIVFVYLMRRFGYLAPNLYIPFVNVYIPMSEPLYFAFSAFVIVGTVNSVNLTDGVDGLATCTTIPVCLFFVAVTFLWGTEYLALGIFASGLLGGLMGFLVYNFNPAKVFMGDTGSLFLGGAVAALAFSYDMPLILLLIGVMYIIETLSDIIQVGYFKLSGGKRVFKMAPFHHHLELGGYSGKKWTEKGLCALFFSVSLVCAVIAFIGVSDRFAF